MKGKRPAKVPSSRTASSDTPASRDRKVVRVLGWKRSPRTGAIRPWWGWREVE